MELMTIEDVYTDIRATQHKRCCLMDNNGNVIVPFNNNRTDIEVRLKEVEARFNSKITKDGVYQIQAKHWGQKAVPAVYYVCKGDLKQGLSDISIEETEVVETVQDMGAFTQDEYNQLYREKIHAEFKIERLEMEISALRGDVELLLGDESEPEQTGFFSDNSMKFFKGLLDNAIPLVDKMLEQKDTKLKLEALKLTQQYQQPAPAQTSEQTSEEPAYDEEEQQEIEDDAHIMTMEHLKENNPQAYADLMNQMAELQNNSPNA